MKYLVGMFFMAVLIARLLEAICDRIEDQKFEELYLNQRPNQRRFTREEIENMDWGG